MNTPMRQIYPNAALIPMLSYRERHLVRGRQNNGNPSKVAEGNHY